MFAPEYSNVHRMRSRGNVDTISGAKEIFTKAMVNEDLEM